MEGYIIVGAFALILLLFLGRGIARWYWGINEVVDNQEKQLKLQQNQLELQKKQLELLSDMRAVLMVGRAVKPNTYEWKERDALGTADESDYEKWETGE